MCNIIKENKLQHLLKSAVIVMESCFQGSILWLNSLEIVIEVQWIARYKGHHNNKKMKSVISVILWIKLHAMNHFCILYFCMIK